MGKLKTMKKILTITLTIIGLLSFSNVAAASCSPLFTAYGGTGTCTIPTKGQVLVGDGNGFYAPAATSTLGISGGGVSGGDHFATSTTQISTIHPSGGNNVAVVIGEGATTTNALLEVNGVSTLPSITSDFITTPNKTTGLLEITGTTTIDSVKGQTSPSSGAVTLYVDPSISEFDGGDIGDIFGGAQIGINDPGEFGQIAFTAPLGTLFGDNVTFFQLVFLNGGASTTALTVSSNGHATTTILSNATSTFPTGINLTGTGCFAIQGTCLGGSSSQWTTSGLNIFYNTGNVGISSSTPFAALSVNSGSSILDAENIVATTTTINWLSGNTQHIFMGTANVSLSFTNVVPGATLNLTVCNLNSTAGILTFAGNVSFSGGIQPGNTTAANQCDKWYWSGDAGTSTPKAFLDGMSAGYQ